MKLGKIWICIIAAIPLLPFCTIIAVRVFVIGILNLAEDAINYVERKHKEYERDRT